MKESGRTCGPAALRLTQSLALSLFVSILSLFEKSKSQLLPSLPIYLLPVLAGLDWPAWYTRSLSLQGVYHSLGHRLLIASLSSIHGWNDYKRRTNHFTPEQEIELTECSVPRAVRTSFQAEDRGSIPVWDMWWNRDLGIMTKPSGNVVLCRTGPLCTEIEIERWIYVNSICYKILGTVTSSCPFSNSFSPLFLVLIPIGYGIDSFINDLIK